jgi:hypothetical protein
MLPGHAARIGIASQRHRLTPLIPGSEESRWGQSVLRFRNLTTVADTTFAADADDLFEFGLDLLIRGLAAHSES